MNQEVNLLLSQNPDFKFVAIRFAREHTTELSKPYTYKTLYDLKVDDLVIVNTPGEGYKTAVVSDVLDLYDVDLDKYRYKWIVSKVDVEEYDRLNNAENQLISSIRRAKTKQTMNDLREELAESIGKSTVNKLLDKVTKL